MEHRFVIICQQSNVQIDVHEDAELSIKKLIAITIGTQILLKNNFIVSFSFDTFWNFYYTVKTIATCYIICISYKFCRNCNIVTNLVLCIARKLNHFCSKPQQNQNELLLHHNKLYKMRYDPVKKICVLLSDKYYN